MNEKDIKKIYAIFFVAPSVMFLQTNFTTIIKSFDNRHKKRRRFSSNFNSSVLPHNKYYIMILNLNRNICVILIVIRMDEGLKRCSFDCGITL